MSLMLEEIAEQPAALERTLREEFPETERLRKRLAERPPAFIALVARGTSDNAAQFGRYLLEITTGIPVSLVAPSVTTLYGAPLRWRDGLVVGLSQSGESTDTNLCLEAARKAGALTCGVTNERNSAMASIVEECLFVHAGRERSVAATKTYTGQLLSMYLLAYAAGAPLDLSAIQALPDAAARALETRPAVETLTERYRYMEHAVVVGRGLNYANAFEFALKLMETCYVVAERFSSADFAHGPIALIEKGFPAFVFAPPGPTRAGVGEMLTRLAGLGAETVVFAPADDREALNAGRRAIALPSTSDGAPTPEDLYTPIPFIIPAQLFAAYLAERKGLDPDQPRALTKVTRTV